MNRKVIYLCSFLAPILLMGTVLFSADVYPGGRETMLIYDLRAQYLPFFRSLRSVAGGDSSLFFHWNKSLGGNYLGLYAYYLASPLSWLTVFFDLEHLPDAIYLLTLLKYGLCGLSMSIFLDHISEKKGRPIIILFACCYALMSYSVIYGICLMWMEGLIFLPLVLLGIEKLLEGKKGGLLYAALTGMFICNYYISYMAGIVAALYLLFRVFALWREKEIKEWGIVICRFGLSSLLAAGCAMPLILPAIRDLSTGKIKLDQGVEQRLFHYPFWRIFVKLLPVQYDSVTSNGAMPSLFCGTAMLLFACAFFLQKQVKTREKIGAMLVLVFFLCSFWLVPLDFVWHGFQYPNDMPYRYAFGFSMFVIYFAYRGYLLVEGVFDRFRGSRWILLFYTVIELWMNSAYIYNCRTLECKGCSSAAYRNETAVVSELLERIRQSDAGEYRLEEDFAMTANDGFLYGYKGMRSFSSAFNFEVNRFLKAYGYEQYGFLHTGNGATELMDSLLGVKYRLSKNGEQKDYVLTDKEKLVEVYRNPYALAIAYLVPDTLQGAKYAEDKDAFARQNELLSAMTDENARVFLPLDCDLETMEDGWCCRFTAPSDNPLYFHIDGKAVGSVRVWDELTSSWQTVCPIQVSANGLGLKRSLNAKDTESILYLGAFREGEEVRIDIREQQGLSFQLDRVWVSELDTGSMELYLNQLRKGELQVAGSRGAVLEGTVTAKKGQALFTSIPYEKGLQVKVDGLRVAPEVFADTFLMIPLTEGTHTVRVGYRSPGFVPGCVIGILAFGMSGIRFVIPRRKEKLHER